MDKKQLMEKYHLDESHAEWSAMTDSWYSVEAYRLQAGVLPNSENAPDTKETIMAFLDNKDLQFKLLRERGNEFGSIYLSAKRTLYSLLNAPIKKG